jgi:hypothetical protein
VGGTTAGKLAIWSLLREVQRLPRVRQAITLAQEEDWEHVNRQLTQTSHRTPVPPNLLTHLGLIKECAPKPQCPKMPWWWEPWVETHAVERYAEHYPRAGNAEMLWDLVHGVEITPELATSMLGRYRSSLQDVYLLGQERRGIFVLSKEHLHNTETICYPTTVITYIRLSLSGEAFALREWPLA